MSRVAHSLAVATAIFALGSLAAPLAATARVSRCATGDQLRGGLTELGTSCRTARRVASGYFTESPPGEHVGSLIIHGFYCEGSYRRSAFHVSCYHGHAHVWFVGTA